MNKKYIIALAVLASFAMPALAQIEKDSIAFGNYAQQSIYVGANVSFDLEQSTASVSVITSETTNRRSAKNIGNSILGQGLGLVSLQTSGTYESANPTFYVRGLQSLSGSSPLVLVDGIERDMKYVSAEEVESVQVLKDAAAVALYGYKGANGAILITTKRGKFNSQEIKVTLDHAINFMANKPKFVDAQTYANAMNEARSYDGLSATYSPEEVAAFGNGSYPYLYPNVNWVDETFRNNSVTNMLNASFQGGGEKFKYYAMLDLQYNNGSIKNANENEGYSTNNKYVKGNLRVNLDAYLTPTTLMKVNLLGVLSEANSPGASANLWNMIYSLPAAAFPVRTENGLWGGNATWSGSSNPVAQSQGAGYVKNHDRGVYTDLTIRQDLSSVLPGLGAQARIGYDNFSTVYENHSKTYTYGSQGVNGWIDGEPELGTFYTGGSESELGSSSETSAFKRRTHFDISVDYTGNFGSHSLYSMLKYDFEGNDEYSINSTIYRQNISLYNHYGYKNRYYVDLALVESGSNRLAPGSKWNFSPTISGAWILSKENWMKQLSWLDFLKLRASWGIINADYLPNDSWNYYVQQYSISGGTYPFNSSFASSAGNTTLGTMATENLGHEKAIKYNVGVDATLFKGLDITIDAYYQNRTDIWVSTEGKYTALIGIDAPYEPDGRVVSWGTELGLDYHKQISGVQLNIGGNLTYNRNEIKEQDEEPRLYDNLIQTGHSLNQIYGLKAIGFFKDQADIDASPTQTFSTVRPGDIKYEDVNDDGIIDANDKVAIGYSTSCPELYYSLHLGAEWKGLGVYAMFQGTGRYSALLTTAGMYKPLISNANLSQYYYDNRWTPETASTAKFPALSSSSNSNNYQTNTLWLADRSFLKLRNIEVYYNLPKSWLVKTGCLNAVKLYVRGIDLFSIDHMDVSDPESYGATAPLNRSVVAGLTVTF